MPHLAPDGQRTCVWCSCPRKGQRTTDERCPECGIPTEALAGFASGSTLTFDSRLLSPRPFIVTLNDVPGYRITHVHGDVFGLVVVVAAYGTAVTVERIPTGPRPPAPDVVATA